MVVATVLRAFVFRFRVRFREIQKQPFYEPSNRTKRDISIWFGHLKTIDKTIETYNAYHFVLKGWWLVDICTRFFKPRFISKSLSKNFYSTGANLVFPNSFTIVSSLSWVPFGRLNKWPLWSRVSFEHLNKNHDWLFSESVIVIFFKNQWFSPLTSLISNFN